MLLLKWEDTTIVPCEPHQLAVQTIVKQAKTLLFTLRVSREETMNNKQAEEEALTLCDKWTLQIKVGEAVLLEKRDFYQDADSAQHAAEAYLFEELALLHEFGQGMGRLISIKEWKNRKGIY